MSRANDTARDDYPEVPFTLTRPPTWMLFTPAEKRVSRVSYEITMRCAEAFGTALLSPDDLSLLAELHARFEVE